MHILLTNDDGIYASGLRSLYHILTQKGHTVSTVAPIKEQSGASNSITIKRPVKTHYIKEKDFQGTALEGTPADCVKIGLTHLLKNNTPDLLISGINAGENIGLDSLYSGTIAAAAEACLTGIPAIAVSRQREEIEPVETYASHLASLITNFDLSKFNKRNIVININYPSTSPSKAQGVKVCPLSMQPWKETFEKKENGEAYWWLSGYSAYTNPKENTDVYFLQKNWITITPLQFDLTAKEYLTSLEQQCSSLSL